MQLTITKEVEFEFKVEMDTKAEPKGYVGKLPLYPLSVKLVEIRLKDDEEAQEQS